MKYRIFLLFLLGHALNAAEPTLQDQLVALTPELPDKTLSTAGRNPLEFKVLTDLNLKVANSCGLGFELTPELRERYRSFFDQEDFNGTEAGNGTLPHAATSIIARQDGTIRRGFLDADYRDRAEPSGIVSLIAEMDV